MSHGENTQFRLVLSTIKNEKSNKQKVSSERIKSFEDFFFLLYANHIWKSCIHCQSVLRGWISVFIILLKNVLLCLETFQPYKTGTEFSDEWPMLDLTKRLQAQLIEIVYRHRE